MVVELFYVGSSGRNGEVTYVLNDQKSRTRLELTEHFSGVVKRFGGRRLLSWREVSEK